MLQVRPADGRGRTRLDWLDSRHTFSFGDYFDEAQMGFRALRVINDDRVAPGAGFPTHSHREMEILTYVIEGALEHKDSIGNTSVIQPGDLQRMSAGSGVKHSEFNHSETEPVRFLQMWILPERVGIEPSYEQRSFPAKERRGRLRLIGSREGREGAVTIHQEVELYAGLLERGEEAGLRLNAGRHAWIQVVRGSLVVAGNQLEEGDGGAMSEEEEVLIRARGEAEFLLFDLA